MGGPVRRSGWRRRRCAAALAAGALTASLLTLVPTGAASAGGGLEFLGYWPAITDASEAALIVDDEAERLYMIRNIADGGEETDPRFVINTHLADGTLVGTPRVERLALVGSPTSTDKPAVYTLDEERRTLYVVAYPSVPGLTGLLRTQAAAPRLMAFDVTNPEAITKKWEKWIPAVPAKARIVGMRFEPDGADERLYIVAQIDMAGRRVAGVLVGEFDPFSNTTAVIPTFPPVLLRGCQRVVSTAQPAAITHLQSTTGDTLVFVGCAPGSPDGANGVGVPAAVQEVNFQHPEKNRTYFLPGTYVLGESFVDPEAGAEGRIVLVGSAALRPGQAVWVFDLEHRRVIAQIAAATIASAGFNTGTGHVYVGTGKNVLLGSDRGMPVPGSLPPIDVDALSTAALAGSPTPAIEATVSGRAVVARFNATVYIPVQRKGETINAVRYAIFRDLTTDADLTPGSLQDWAVEDTKVAFADQPQYQAGGRAFGLRVHQLGGVTAPVTNNVGFAPTWWNDPVLPGLPVPSWAQITGADDGDRDLKFGRVSLASMKEGEAAALATGASADERTNADHLSLTRRQKNFFAGHPDPSDPDPDIEGDQWPFGRATCSRFRSGTSGGGAQSSAADTTAEWAQGAPAAVMCDLDHDAVSSSGTFEGLRHLGPVSVGFSTSSVDVEKMANGGVKVVSWAEVRDVRIGDVVHIGRISARSEASAFGGRLKVNGRRVADGAAAAAYTTEFEHVVMPGFECPEGCDPKVVSRQLVEALNQLSVVAGLQVQVDIPGAEVLVTPGGAHAHSWREPWEHKQEELINAQSPEDTEVPALRLLVIADADLPSRTIFEFAATSANANHLALRDVPPEPPLPPDPDDRGDGDDDRDDDSDVGTTVATPVTGTGGGSRSTSPGVAPSVRTVTVKGKEVLADTLVPDAGGALKQFLDQVTSGAKWLLGRALPAFLLSLCVWMLFGAGPFLAARRRHLTRLGRVASGR
jgi:hypothetical protein